MLSDTSYKTHSFLKKPTPFMGGSISRLEFYGKEQNWDKQLENWKLEKEIRIQRCQLKKDGN